MARVSVKSPTAVTVDYSLFDLPTAQHKAGLAGLLFQIQHMEAKSPRPPAIPKVMVLTGNTATIEFTAESVQCLFDDVYAAELAEVRSRTKWQGAEPLRTETVEEEVETEGADGRPTKQKVRQKYFYYLQVQPAGGALRQFVVKGTEHWLKLWREMLWAIPRGIPKTRIPYEERASRKPCGEGAVAWDYLVKADAKRKSGAFHTAEVASSLWLGAQATNAEGISFQGRVEQTLLLHFWPLIAQVYTPQAIQPDGTTEFVGFVLAIPEVADLKGFLADYPQVLGELQGDLRGYRPAEAVIDLPGEGALSFLEHLARLTASKGSDPDHSQLTYSNASMEFLHLVKIGNTVKTLAAGRLAPRSGLLGQYLRIVGRVGEKPPYANPLFRRGLLLALLDNKPWYQPFGKLFAELNVSFFIPSDAPPKLSWFWIDARKKIQEVIQAMPTAPHTTPSPDADSVLMALLHRLTRTYLAARAKEKSGIDPEKFKDGDKIAWDRLPKEFHEARRSVGETLFYEFRSRHGQPFVGHFSQTFFAAKQYLSETQYAEIGHALLNRTDDVKTLTLMALSANS
jgi:CRISPR-associated protein Cmx8